MADPRKDVPSPNSANFDARVREEVMRYLGRIGDKLDRGVTLRDLVDAGIVKLRSDFLAGRGTTPIAGPGNNAGDYPPDLTPPPTPTGFALDSAISSVFVECDAQIYRQGHGHADTVLYGVTVADGDPLPTFSDAVELASFPGTVFAYSSNPSLTWRMWIKWRTVDGVLSADPAGGINGLEIKTGLDVALLVKAMTGPGNPFKIVTAPMTLPDGSLVPEGTYTSDAFIHNGQIVNAKIANLAVDDAKIASLSVGKLTAGSLNVGAYVQSTNYVSGVSGFRINGAGFAEFSSGTFRGTIVAAAGAIGGIVINATSLRSSNYNGTVGFALNSDGTLDLPNGSIFAAKLNVVNLAAVSANLGAISSGAVTINQDGGGGWGYIRTPAKWLNDGVHGWVMARHADESVFWDFTANNMKFYGYDLAPQGGGQAAVIDFAGAFYADSSGYMEVRRASVIDTFNIAGQAVTVPAGASADNRVTITAFTPINGARLVIPSYDSRGSPVFIFASANCRTIDTGGGDTDPSPSSMQPVRIRIYRGGAEYTNAICEGSTGFYVNFPNGAAEIWCTFEPASSSGNAYVYERTVALIGMRR